MALTDFWWCCSACGGDQSCFEQIELGAVVHLAFNELGPGYLTLRLAIRPLRGDCIPDGREVLSDAGGERGDEAGAGVLEPG